MAEPFLSEIRIFPFTFAPRGWAFCNGQTLAIAQNEALFALLGTTYGGDGIQNFYLPDLRGRIAIGPSTSHPIGQQGGEASHTVTIAEIPAHMHLVNCNTGNGNVPSPQNAYWAADNGGNFLYGSGNPDTVLAADVINVAGGNQPHENMMPFLTLNFCIALQGIFPSRS